MILSNAQIANELEIQKKYNIKDVVITGRLGVSIAVNLIKEKNKTFCKLCEKKFTEMEPPIITTDKLVEHIWDHFDDGYRATIEEIETYFS